MSVIAIELLFRQQDDTPLEIIASEIEIKSSIQNDGLIYFGLGSRFRYQKSEYRIIDLEVHYIHMDHEGKASKLPPDLKDQIHVRISYTVEPLLL